MADSAGYQLAIAAALIGGSVLVASMGGCNVSQSETMRVLSKQGYTDIHVTGHAWFACGKGDEFGSNFTAKSPSGAPVTGSICGGWFKNYTVRYD